MTTSEVATLGFRLEARHELVDDSALVFHDLLLDRWGDFSPVAPDQGKPWPFEASGDGCAYGGNGSGHFDGDGYDRSFGDGDGYQEFDGDGDSVTVLGDGGYPAFRGGGEASVR